MPEAQATNKATLESQGTLFSDSDTAQLRTIAQGQVQDAAAAVALVGRIDCEALIGVDGSTHSTEDNVGLIACWLDSVLCEFTKAGRVIANGRAWTRPIVGGIAIGMTFDGDLPDRTRSTSAVRKAPDSVVQHTPGEKPYHVPAGMEYFPEFPSSGEVTEYLAKSRTGAARRPIELELLVPTQLGRSIDDHLLTISGFLEATFRRYTSDGRLIGNCSCGLKDIPRGIGLTIAFDQELE